MITYPKIETLFERATDGSNRLIKGKFRSEAVAATANLEWEFTEKIDGTNVRVGWDGHKGSFGGRTERAQLPTPLVNRLNEVFGGDEKEELFEQLFGAKEVVLFGEGYGAGIQKGGGYRSNQDFILFDVNVDGMWLKRESVEDIAKAFGVEVVPVIFCGTVWEAVDRVEHKPTSLVAQDRSMIAEGYVGRAPAGLLDRCGNRLIVKVKVKDFV